MRKLDRRRRANFEFVREGQFQKEAEVARIRVGLHAGCLVMQSSQQSNALINFEFVREGQFQKEAEVARIRVGFVLVGVSCNHSSNRVTDCVMTNYLPTAHSSMFFGGVMLL